jgi:hypothetical protein
MIQIGLLLLAAYFGWIGIWGVAGGPGTTTSKPVAIATLVLAIILLVAAVVGPSLIMEYIAPP